MIRMEAEQRVEDNERLRQNNAGPGRPPPAMIVAGNKCDLKDNRAVSSRQGLEYARKNGCGFMETSAREMVNIEETFARTNPFVGGFEFLNFIFFKPSHWKQILIPFYRSRSPCNRSSSS